jgi:hypothetical protein
VSDLIDSFSSFVELYHDLFLPAGMNLVFYSVLKTEGDILMDLQEIDLAIKCYKTVKDQCSYWGNMDDLKLKCYE